MNDFTRAHKLTNRAKIIIHSANSAWKPDNVANFRYHFGYRKTTKQISKNKTKQKRGGKKEEERWKKQRCGEGLKLCTINAVERWSSRINGAIDSLKKTATKKQCKRISRQWMKERTYILCFRKPIHHVCEVRRKTYVTLSRFPLLFWS